MKTKTLHAFGAGAMIAATILGGCTSRPPPVLAPVGAMVADRNFAGTPLSGPLATDNGGLPPQNALDVKVSFFALSKMPQAAGEPLSPRVHLIVAAREDTPVVPSPRLMPGVRFAESDQAIGIEADIAAGKLGPFALISTQESALISGATAAFALSKPPGEADQFPGQSKSQRLELELYRPSEVAGAVTANPMQAALLLNDFVEAAPLPESEEAFAADARPAYAHGRFGTSRQPTRPPPPPPVFQSEMALFSPGGVAANGSAAPGSPDEKEVFAVIAPLHFRDSDSQAIVAIVEISPLSADPSQAQAVARAMDDIRQSSAAAAHVADLIHTDPPDWPGLAGAVESLTFAGRQRAGLVYLANQTDARTTEDVVLSADETIISPLAQAVAKAIAAAPGERTHQSIGWLLERTTYQMILQIQSGGKLPPDLEAILAVRTGQAGRSSGTLQEVLAHANGQQDMLNRLAAENYIFLEDSSPAARVRAFDWLTMQKLAPPNFDPLASPRQRRAALEQAEQAPLPAAGSVAQPAAH